MNDLRALDRAAQASLARLDRRTFLRAAGVVLGAGVLPTGCGGVPPEIQPPPGVTLARFSARGYATFQAVAMRMVGPQGAEAIRARQIDPAHAADQWAVRMPALAGPLLQGLGLVEWGVVPLVAKWRPFTALDGAAQDAVLEDLMRSRLDLKRDLFKGLRSLAMLGFYSNARARTAVGHPGALAAAGITLAMSDLPGERAR
jgi:hypothetical protein